MVALVVEKEDRDEVYRDSIRVHRTKAGGVRSGHLARVRNSTGGSGIFVVHGLPEDQQDIVQMDWDARNKLKVEIGKSYDFKFKRATFIGSMGWALNASDPALRVASLIAVLSFFLGVLSLTLSIVGFLI